LSVGNEVRELVTPPTPERVDARGIPGLGWKLLTGALMSTMIVAAFQAEPIRNAAGAPTFHLGGHAAKIIFFHVPCAWLSILSLIVGVWFAVRTVRATRIEASNYRIEDAKCAAAMELGLLFAVLATVTGSIFSRIEWGMFWSWDVRQWSILIVMLLFMAYAALRGALVDPETRARLSASYAALSAIPGLFLYIVLPRVMQTLHSEANQAVVQGGLGTNYRIVLMGMSLPAFTLLYVWLFQLRVRTSAVVVSAGEDE
jgi:heme exporter protein C